MKKLLFITKKNKMYSVKLYAERQHCTLNKKELEEYIKDIKNIFPETEIHQK